MTLSQEYVRFDWAMKRLLRNKASYGVLEGFLTSLLGRSIKIERLLESESNQTAADSKFNRVDILAEDSDGSHILIEVQNESEDAYFHRMLFGTSRLVSEYLKLGQDYGKIRKIYSINIVYFNLGEGSDYVYHGQTEFRGVHDGDVLSLPKRFRNRYNVGTIGDIFPEYYILKVNDFDKWSKNSLDQWMYFLSSGRIPNDAEAPGLEEARENLKIAMLSKEEQTAYRSHIDNMVSMRNIVADARDEGIWIGREEGVQIGREEGVQIGREEAILEKARIAKQNGLSDELIKTIFGLDESQINKL